MIKDESHLCQSPARERRGAGSSQLIIQPSAALPAPARTALLRGRAGMGGAVCSELVELVTAGGSGVVVAGLGQDEQVDWPEGMWEGCWWAQRGRGVQRPRGHVITPQAPLAGAVLSA